MFIFSNIIINFYLKTMKKINKHMKIVILGRSILNEIKKVISKALENAEVSHEEFTLVSNEV